MMAATIQRWRRQSSAMDGIYGSAIEGQVWLQVVVRRLGRGWGWEGWLNMWLAAGKNAGGWGCDRERKGVGAEARECAGGGGGGGRLAAAPGLDDGHWVWVWGAVAGRSTGRWLTMMLDCHCVAGKNYRKILRRLQ
ncbi:unnamed protein product [Cuscuta europaea]|uniref:Uncharacterized protein n=1 Tax=Cuscuta europaea TaxID=41803 RepID=A0A9P0YRC6_CUSEU|nr:unnamed protein product [Cuscuta europaea]